VPLPSWHAVYVVNAVVYGPCRAVPWRHTQGVRKKDRADRASFCTALCMLCARAGKNVMRDKMLFAARIGQTLGLSLIIMGVYGKLSLTQVSKYVGGLLPACLPCYPPISDRWAVCPYHVRSLARSLL
jgi:hypothetical protein